MTPEEIRAEAIERMARLYYGGAKSEAVKNGARRMVVQYVDALGDLLPTQMEERTLEDGMTGMTGDFRTGEVSYHSKPCTRQRRYVTDWGTP